MPTLSALLLRVRLPRNDYLRVALVLSLAIHAGVLALRLTDAPASVPPVNALEVTLVNAHSQIAPLSPRILAQEQLDGGGEAAGGQAASPLPRTAAESPDEVVLAALRKRQEELEAEQQKLYMQLLSQQKAQPERPQPDVLQEADDAGTDTRDQESLIVNARISVLKDRIERYNAQPRKQFSGPSARAVDYAQYVEAWRQKIELLGTEHYPQEARGRVYGSLQMTVYIRKDGSVERTEIDRPSPHAVLNLAATRIVQLAAPFAPLPASIANDTDVFAITRTWNFMNQQLETLSP
jgi:protein TonB